MKNCFFQRTTVWCCLRAILCGGCALLWLFGGGALAGVGGYSGKREWVGGGANENWNVNANWVDPPNGNAAPPAASILTLSFGGEPALTTSVNNLGSPQYRVGEILFTNDGSAGKSASFILDGNDILLGDGDGNGGGINTTALVSNAGSAITDIINLDMDLNALDGDPLDFAINSNHHLQVAGDIYDNTGTNRESDLLKTGDGTLIFEGANTYQGTTTVREGTLLINGSQTNEGGLLIESGGTLGGDGVIGGTTTIEGIHAPGNSPGIQSFENLAYEDGSSVTWELINSTTSGPGVNFDRIQVSGDLAFNASTTPTVLNLDFTGLDWDDAFWNYGLHEWQIWGVAGTTTGFPANLVLSDSSSWVDTDGVSFVDARGSALPSSANFSLFENDNSIYLRYEALPEPTTFGLLGLVLAGLTAFSRPRRKLR